jgi:hypothetical protein
MGNAMSELAGRCEATAELQLNGGEIRFGAII